jgi:CheY-like chemotaxis protein
VAEDNPGDVYLVRRALEAARITIPLHIAADGEEAYHFIDELEREATGVCPRLVLLDLNMPRRSGQEVLTHLRQSEKMAAAPVIIVTSSDSPVDREELARLGANDYFCKPSTYEEYMKLGEVVRRHLSGGNSSKGAGD